MALRQHKLFALEEGRHFDTDRSKRVPGLHLRVTGDARSWVLRCSIRGKRCEFGLGSLLDTPLALARERALVILVPQIFAGLDPRAERAQRRTNAVPFRDIAADVIKLIPEERYRSATASRFVTYLAKTLGDLLPSQITSGVVVAALRPIWIEKASTATNALSFVSRCLVEARARGLKPQSDVIEEAKAALGKQQREVKRRRALPLEELPALMAKLRAMKTASARALELCILTGHRSGTVLKARPDEFAGAVWTSPAAHQKSRRLFRTPLSKRAQEIVAEMKLVGAPTLFPIHVNAMADLLRDLAPDCDVHGFRSVLLGWSRKAGVPRDEQGLLLQHTEKDRVRAAYARGDLLEERAPIMERWSDFCRDGQKPAKLRRVA